MMTPPGDDPTPPRDLAAFFRRFTRQSFSAKATIITAAEPPKGVYFVTDGHVRQYLISNRDGLILTLRIFHPGSLFPFNWAIDSSPNLTYYETITPVELYRAPHDELARFVHLHPAILQSLFELSLWRIENMQTRISYQVFGDALVKVASDLVYLARHFGTRQGEKIIIDHAFSHQTIGEFTGLARETVSVAIEKLEDKGIVSYRRRKIVIDDMKRLEKESLYHR